MSKETIRVSFTFDAEGELDEELEFLHAKAKHSRIKKLVEDHIREKIKDPMNNPDFLKDMKVNFSIPNSRTREQIITSMCFTYRHDYGIVKNSPSISGMTEEERKSLWKRMAQIFDSDIAPYVDLKCFGEQPAQEEVNIKEELSRLDRNNWDDVCKLVDKIVYDIMQTSKMAPYSYIGDQDALEGLIKDYMIDLINPDLLDFDSKNKIN
jgi:hypothetical protein